MFELSEKSDLKAEFWLNACILCSVRVAVKKHAFLKRIDQNKNQK